MRRRVLIVDDEPNVVLALKTALTRAGFDVAIAGDGPEVLAVLGRSASPDLVLLDVSMPGLDGYDVCTRIRAEPRSQAIKIIMLTARDREADRARALAAGADAYVLKPFRTGDMVERVRGILGAGSPDP